MSTESRSPLRVLRRPAQETTRRPVFAASLGADLSSLGGARGENSTETVDETVVEPAAVAQPAPVAQAAPVAQPVAPVVEAQPVSVPLAVIEPATVVEDRQSLQSALEDLLAFDGSIGVALVDGQSGMILGEAGSAGNLGLSAAGASVILRSRLDTNKALGRAEEIADVLITLSSQIQIIHPLAKNPKLFLFLIGDKAKASLAMARYKATEADASIRL